MSSFVIRPAYKADYSLLPEIEEDAARAFAEAGLTVVAEMEPAEAESYRALPVLYVAESPEGLLMGFAAGKVVDGQAYLQEVSVRHACTGKGIGRQLIEAVAAWAREKGFRYLALTTFRDLPFNARFYQKSGFEIFEPDETWPELKAMRAAEQEGILSVAPRVAMRLRLSVKE